MSAASSSFRFLGFFLILSGSIIASLGGGALFHLYSKHEIASQQISHESRVISHVLAERFSHLQELTLLQANFPKEELAQKSHVGNLSILIASTLASSPDDVPTDIPSHYAAKALVATALETPAFSTIGVELHGAGEDMVIRTAIKFLDENDKPTALLLDWNQKAITAGIDPTTGSLHLLNPTLQTRWSFGAGTTSALRSQDAGVSDIKGTNWKLSWLPAKNSGWGNSLLQAGVWPFLVSAIIGIFLSATGIFLREKSNKQLVTMPFISKEQHSRYADDVTQLP